MYRIEDWQISRREKHSNDIHPKLISKKYHIYLPGVSIEDILNSNNNIGVSFKQSDVKQALHLLLSHSLIRAIKVGHEIRYVINDNDLHHFVSALKEYFISEFDYLLWRWNNLETPTLQKGNAWNPYLERRSLKKYLPYAK